MSVNSIVAGTRFFGLNIAVRRSRRASGTFEMPTAVSPFPLGASFALVINWNSVDLPVEGKPISAACSMENLRGLPIHRRATRCGGQTAFGLPTEANARALEGVRGGWSKRQS